MSLPRALAGGLAGGTIGAVAMLPLYEGAKRLGIVSETPPNRVVDEAAATAAEATEAGGPIEPGEHAVAMVGSHLLYGAAAGAFYGLVQDELELPPLVAGTAYGLALWVAGYIGWMPATGVLPEPWHQRTGEAMTPVLAHGVYGLVLGVVAEALGRR